MILVVRVALLLVLGAGIVFTGALLDSSAPRTRAHAPPQLPAPGHAEPVVPDEDVIHGAIEAAPFRADRQLPIARYGVSVSAELQSHVEPRPVLSLRGVLWGARPAAILEGVPGTSGQVVLVAGDTVGGLRVKAILPASVTIAGRDTVWVLVLAAPQLPGMPE